MILLQRTGALVLSVAIAGSALVPSLLMGQAAGGGAATAPVTPGSGGGAATAVPESSRTVKQIDADMNQVQRDLQDYLQNTRDLGSATYREKNGAKVIPLLRKMITLLEELEKVSKEAADKGAARSARMLISSFAMSLGDKEAQAFLEAAAKENNDHTLAAKSALAMGLWCSSSTDAAAQAKVLEEYEAVVQKNADNMDVAKTLFFMGNVGGATPELSKKVATIASTHLKGALRDNVLEQLGQAQTMREAEEMQKKLVGTALTIEGRMISGAGGKFTSTSIKGKVVLVDFWATWCGPCVAGLPELKNVYNQYKGKGLEIVGVSCDSEDGVVSKFTKENDMPWTQLREASQDARQSWHPLTKQYGVMGIPTMFLIDRKGVVRYVDARMDLAKKVEELLKEEAPKE